MTHRRKKPQESPTAKDGLMITTETVVSAVVQQIEIRGLDEAVRQFDVMAQLFSGEEGWAATSRKVNEIFRQVRERLKQEKAGSHYVDNSRHITMNGGYTQYSENPGYDNNPRKNFIT